jgi:transcription elongation factor
LYRHNSNGKRFIKASAAAGAERTLAWIAMRIPNWPTIKEKDAPNTNAMERPNEMINWVFWGNSSSASALGFTT